MSSLTCPKRYLTVFFLTLAFLLTLFPNTTSAQESANSCSKIGNNTAVPFSGGGDYSEAQFTLGLYDGNIIGIDKLVNNSPGKVIIRYGTGGGKINIDDITPEKAEKYAQDMISVANKSDPNKMVVLISHNEINCAEHPLPPGAGGNQPVLNTAFGQQVFDKEIMFARTVASTIKASGLPIELSTGQIDYLCGDFKDWGRKSPQEYINALTPLTDGRVSLPFYTGDAGNSSSSLALFGQFAANNKVYITESGPFKRGTATPSDEEFKDYVSALAQITSKNNVLGIALFNAFGLNNQSSSIFMYTSRFWNQDCRKALREQCTDPEAVLLACSGAKTFSTDKACFKNFCKGEKEDPCKYTPELDCSFPFNEQDVLAPLTDRPELRARISSYIRNYLDGRAMMSQGWLFDFQTEISDPSACYFEPNKQLTNTELARKARCEQAFGEGSAPLELGSNITTITPTGNSPQARRLEYTSTNVNTNQQQVDATNMLNLGRYNLLNPITELNKHRAATANFKEYCYNRIGPVDEWINHFYFKDVRCANYVNLENPSCSGMDITNPNNPEVCTERDLYYSGPKPLEPCLELIQPDLSQTETKKAQKRCNQAYAKLTPFLRDSIMSLSEYPIARFPVFGLNDPFISDQDENILNKVQETNSKLLDIVQNYQWFFKGLDTLGKHQTAYYVYTIVTAQDMFISAQLAHQKLIPREVVDQIEQQQNQQAPSGSNSIIQALVRFLQAENPQRPFWWTHIPPDKRELFDIASGDQRFIALSLFANESENYDKCTKNNEADSTPDSIPVNIYNDLGQRITNIISSVTTPLFDLTWLLSSEPRTADNGELVKGIGLKSEYQLQKYVNCEIHPNKGNLAQTYTLTAAQSITPKEEMDLLKTQDEKKPRYTTYEFKPEGGFSTKEAEPCIKNKNELDNFLLDNPGKSPRLCCNHETSPDSPNCVYTESVPSGKNTGSPRNKNLETTTLDKVNEDIGKTAINSDRTQIIQPATADTDKAWTLSFLKNNWLHIPKELKVECPTDNYLSYVNYKLSGDCSVKTPPPNQDSLTPVCKLSGGYEIASESLKSLIARAAQKYNVPVQLLMAVLWGENCRSNTLYNGESASICKKSEAQLLPYLKPGQEWLHTAGCTSAGDGTDAKANAQVSKGVSQHYHGISTGWGVYRVSPGANICNISDSIYAMAAHLSTGYFNGASQKSNIGKAPSAKTWTVADMKKAATTWALGNNNTPCAGDAASFYCKLIDDYTTPQGSSYINTTCNR